MIEPFAGATAVVDPTAFVHRSAVLIGDIKIGAESSVWPNTTLRGDDGPIVIGAQTSIQDGTVIHCTRGLSFTQIGDRVTVGHGVILHGCQVESDCLIGMGAILLDQAVIEAGAFVAAGTLVPPGKRVPAHTVVMGNPFRIVRTCDDRDRALIDFSWREYIERTRQYLDSASR
jgi:carbonic anhydrase/acetyltransferase-like protein (isoleucine patch superfamily)